MKKKQVLATLCAGMMVASVATGCGAAADSAADSTAASTDSTDASTEASSASTTADGKTQLNILWWGSQTRHELTTQMLEKFQEENPDIEVVMVYSDWDGFWTKLPAQVAGGEQQRGAIARALASDAKVLLADEPTGNLDEATAWDVIDLLKHIAYEEKKCVIVVTHSKELAQAADEIIHIGRIHAACSKPNI